MRDANRAGHPHRGNKRQNTAISRSSKASSSSTLATYNREGERESKKAGEAQNQRARISKKIADKSSEAARVQAAIGRAEQAESKKRIADDAKRQRIYDQRIRDLEDRLAEQAASINVPILRADAVGQVYDFFISHASEDKEDFVVGLVTKAREAGLNIWYDNFELEWGDNAWEELKRKGDASIKKWIDDNMHGKSCVVVLVGSETAERKWVQHEISKGWNDNKGVLGIRINGLLGSDGKSCPAGSNPFSNITFNTSGKSLDAVAPLKTPTGGDSKAIYASIANNIEAWIEEAISIRARN